MAGVLLVGGKILGIVVNYYYALVRVGAGRFHVLCYHVVSVIDHMDPGDVVSVLFGIYGWW